MAQLLITGGAGFIGSHSCLVLLEAGHNLVVLDNFDNSSPESLKRVLELAGPSAAGRLQLVEGDIRSAGDLERAFKAARPAGQSQPWSTSPASRRWVNRCASRCVTGT